MTLPFVVFGSSGDQLWEAGRFATALCALVAVARCRAAHPELTYKAFDSQRPEDPELAPEPIDFGEGETVAVDGVTFRPGETYRPEQAATAATLRIEDPRRAWTREFMAGWRLAAQDIRARREPLPPDLLRPPARAAGYRAALQEARG